MINIQIKTAEEMQACGASIAQSYWNAIHNSLADLIKQRSFIIYLHGNLGAGKTTWVRGFLRGLGYNDKVKSPTFTLIEPYTVKNHKIYHFDLYRLKDPLELEYLGANDYFNEENSLCLIEWPEYGKNLLPPEDVKIDFSYPPQNNNNRTVTISGKFENIFSK